MRAPEVDDREPVRGERRDGLLLVGVPAVGQGFDARVLSELDVQPAYDAGAVELGEMAAGELVGDVVRGEEECRIAEAHRGDPGGAREGGTGQ